MRFGLLFLLIGCMPADHRPLQNEGDGQLDVADSDTDVSTPGEDDTDIDWDDRDMPNLDSLEISATGGILVIAFDGPDGGYLAGGRFLTMLDGVLKTYEIPEDLATWDPTTQSGTVLDNSLADWDCDATVTIRAQLRDAEDWESTIKMASTNWVGFGLVIPDYGNAAVDAYDVGRATVGDVFCGTLSTVAQGTGDLDWILFDGDNDGFRNYVLTWREQDADYDLFLYDNWLYPLTVSVNVGAVQPEAISLDPIASWVFLLSVSGWSGPAGDWMLRVE
ncbi:MAG: hypothetical protein HN348_03690 [Proteobacteria bacterium]|jgi:hypothetical protein|nr:hypothetical protein [Pseudomonadota bacterium]